jgi:hypothetical protein
MRAPRTFIAWIVAAALAAFLAAPSFAHIKLYLKDGSFQLVSEYEIEGDRLRFYSVERSAWEEIPLRLVDFEATEKARAEEEAGQQAELEKARELGRQRFERAGGAPVEVAPGVFLPPEEGAYADDELRVVRMIQSPCEVVTDRKRAVLLLAVPFGKSRAVVLLPGPKAAVRVLNAQPTFYVRGPIIDGSRVELLALKSRKDAREVGRVGARGKEQEEFHETLPLEREELSPGLFRLKPVEPLELGEYALGEIMDGKLNLDVWDFGIDGAPATPRLDEDAPPRIRRSEKPADD